uniref:Uncharacterized protein n=1 Tax=Aegilops tauschii subsp. strangulata TaxID=200361 RepID=A0A453S467_AEGTS
RNDVVIATAKLRTPSPPGALCPDAAKALSYRRFPQPRATLATTATPPTAVDRSEPSPTLSLRTPRRPPRRSFPSPYPAAVDRSQQAAPVGQARRRTPSSLRVTFPPPPERVFSP